jgi:hypothetical protein
MLGLGSARPTSASLSIDFLNPNPLRSSRCDSCCCTRRRCAACGVCWLAVVLTLVIVGAVGYENAFWLTPPSVSLGGIRVESLPTWHFTGAGLGTFKTDIGVTLHFTNPNQLQATVNKASANAFYTPEKPPVAASHDSYFLGLVVVDGPVVIPAAGTVDIVLDGRLSYSPVDGGEMNLNLLRDCNILRPKPVEFTLELSLFDMVASLGPLTVPVPPFNISFAVPCPAIPLTYG